MKKSSLEIDTLPQRKILILGGSGFVGRHLLTTWGDLAIGTHKNTAREDTVFFDPISMDLRSIRGIDQCSHAVILYGEREPDVCFMQPEFARALNVESTKGFYCSAKLWGLSPCLHLRSWFFWCQRNVRRVWRTWSHFALWQVQSWSRKVHRRKFRPFYYFSIVKNNGNAKKWSLNFRKLANSDWNKFNKKNSGCKRSVFSWLVFQMSQSCCFCSLSGAQMEFFTFRMAWGTTVSSSWNCF